jgi:hypothetical protein
MWVNNIKMDLSEKGWENMDWIDLAQDKGHWTVLGFHEMLESS